MPFIEILKFVRGVYLGLEVEKDRNRYIVVLG